MLNHGTALHILNDYCELNKGDLVIQSAAHSAVGQSIIQQCAAKEITTVNVVPASPIYEDVYKHLFLHGGNIIVYEDYLKSYKYNELVKALPHPTLAIDGQGGKISLELARKLAYYIIILLDQKVNLLFIVIIQLKVYFYHQAY